MPVTRVDVNGFGGASKVTLTSFTLDGDDVTVQVGDDVFVKVATDALQPTSISAGLSSTATLGSATLEHEGLNSGNVRTRIYRVPVTGGGVLDAVVVNHALSGEARAGVAGVFRGVGTRRGVHDTTAVDTSPSTATPHVVDDLIVAAHGFEGVVADVSSWSDGTAVTATRIALIGTTGGGAASNISVHGVYAFVNTTGTGNGWIQTVAGRDKAYASAWYASSSSDTTPPQNVAISLDAGAATTEDRVIDAAISTSDASTVGYQMKVWGDVDPGADANVQATEAGSAWIAYATAKTLTLSTGEGAKTINVKVRDAASTPNESTTASDAITYNAPPNPPTDLVLTPGNGQVSVAYTASTSPDVTSHEKRYSTDPAFGTSTVFTESTVTGLTNGTTYYFRVTAIDSGGLSSYVEGSAVPTDDVTPPQVEWSSSSRSKISRVAGFDALTANFTADEPVVDVQIRLVPSENSGIADGTLVHQEAISPAASVFSVMISDDELVAAGGVEGENSLKAFVQDVAGNWSPAVPPLTLPFNLPATLGS